jgi:parallel beta-helix repeat protein
MSIRAEFTKDLVIKSGVWTDVRAYGAVGDGATDDSTAIQAAITANRQVLIPPGTFVVGTSLTVPSNTTIMGMGNTSILKADAASSPISILSATSVTNVLIKDLKIDVNRANQSGNADYGIYFNTVTDSFIFDVLVIESYWKGIYAVDSNNIQIRGCRIYNMRDTAIELSTCKKSVVSGCVVEGILADGGLAPDGIRIVGEDLLVSDCVVHDSMYRCFAIEGSAGTHSIRCKIDNCIAYDYKDYGYFMNYNTDCAITNCMARGKGDAGWKASPTGGGIGSRVAVNCLIANNVCEDNWQNGINTGSDTVAGDATSYGISILGNICRNNNQGAGSGWGGIFMYAEAGVGTEDFLVANNICFDDQAAAETQKFGIRISSGSQVGHMIVNNICKGNAETGIVLSGHELFAEGNVCKNNGQITTGYGINLTGASDSVVRGNVCYDDQGTPTQLQGIRVDGGGSIRNDVSGNKCFGNKQEGIYISDTNYCAVNDNSIHANSQQTTDTYDGLELNNCLACTVTGNNISGSDHRYALVLGGTSDTNIVSNNSLAGATTGPASVANSADKFFNNSTFITENNGKTSVANNGTIAHGLSGTPTCVVATTSISTETVQAIGVNAANITVAITRHDGSPGTTQDIYWNAIYKP